MSKKISVPAAIVLALLCGLITFQITFVTMQNKYRSAIAQTAVGSTAYDKLNYVDQVYRNYYIGEIDEEQLSDYLIRGYLVGAGDKYASYMTADEFAAMKEEDTGEMVGIGVHVVYNNDYGALEIVSVMRDSPALEAGVLPGDLIVLVGDESVSELGYYPAVDKMLGDIGSVAKFTVLRGEGYGTAKEFAIVRAVVTETTVDSHMYDNEIGVIRIEQFVENTGTNVKTAIEDLRSKGAKKLIFDVRYNPGGMLESIVETLDYILPEGPILHIVDGEGKEQVISSDAASLDLPMCVLVNSSTASAAELFTCALKDYHKATIIGTNTYGKGTMQQVIALPDGSGLSFSYRMYNPPYSENYEGVGIQPDIELELSEELYQKNFYTITDEEDNQLQEAVKVLKNQ